MRCRSRIVRARLGLTAVAALAALAAPAAAGAQTRSFIPAVQPWIALLVAPGHPRWATDRIQAADPGWTRDALGSLIKVRGSGSPVRVVACGLDEPAYVVSQITDSGYLRVQMDGSGPRRALWDEFHEGQRILIMTGDPSTTGRVQMVPGVFAVRSVHLWRGRTPHEGPTTIDDLWLDVGAQNAAEVAAMGIRLLDPVFRDLGPWVVRHHVAGPQASGRAGCAAVAAASRATPVRGKTIFVISAQHAFSWAGLSGVLARTRRVDSLVVVDEAAPLSNDTVAVRDTRFAFAVPAGVTVGSARTLSVRAEDPGALIERVADADLGVLFARVAAAAGATAPGPFVMPDATAPVVAEVRDSLTPYADLLARLSDRYAVSGHEGPVRDAVRAELPPWARPLAVVDTAGNLYVAAGPDRDTVVIVAHLDEIGFDVAGIEPDGRVALRPRGGFITTLFAGQPALLHTDADSQPAPGRRDCAATSASARHGVFEILNSASAASARTVYAWFGREPAALGIKPGMTVTGYKCAARLGRYRFTARSIDDRAGDVALLVAMRGIDPKTLDHKVIFAFSTREEVGLDGAAALAAEFGVSVRRVLAVDTFVSSDSPLETPRFADAPIGAGAVARMLDNSSVTPPAEFARVVRIAQAGRIPLQWGTTNGGNDGSEFVRYGAVDIPIGWPLRYSHSPAELVDLRDIRSLARLVAALAVAPPT